MPPKYDTVRPMSQPLTIIPGQTITKNFHNWAEKEDNSHRVGRRRLHFSDIEGGRENHPRRN